MKTHPIDELLQVTQLTLRESIKAVWTGGLTALVWYTVRDVHGHVIAKESFHYNRHPGTYQKQGSCARRNTARQSALDRLMKSVHDQLQHRDEALRQDSCSRALTS